MQRILIALALSPAAAYVTPLAHRKPLTGLQMQSGAGVGDLYNSKGVAVASSTTAVEEVVAEDEVIDLKPEAVEAVVVGEEKAEEPAAPEPKAAEPAVENTRATLVGNASRDPGALVFHRNKEQKYATVYTEMEKFFPGVCPELPRPALLDGTHPGDYGFDPAGFCTTNAELYNQMEAEVRHCRLAMLCAAGWPMAELWGQDWFDGYFLADGGRAPSILNGGLISDVQFPPLPTLFVLGFFALYGQQELKTLGTLKCQTLYGNVHKKDLEGLGEEWPWGVAGDEDFDPLGLYGLLGNDAVGRFTMRELELNHGRVAMLAVLSYVMLESVTHVPVVQLTPFLFGKWYW